jgi:hypothetical protein
LQTDSVKIQLFKLNRKLLDKIIPLCIIILNLYHITIPIWIKRLMKSHGCDIAIIVN